MEPPKVRQRNLQRILEEDFGGSQKRLAEAIDRAESYVWQLCFSEKPKFGDKISRHIEEKLGLAKYTLEQHDVPKAQASGGWPFSFPPHRWKRLTDEQRTHIERTVEAMIAGYEAQRPAEMKRAGNAE
jgi:hypothetical protein